MVLILVAGLLTAFLAFQLSYNKNCELEDVYLIDPEKYPADKELTLKELSEMQREADRKYGDFKKKLSRGEFDCRQ